MLIVADTTPIISLMKAGHLNLFHKMFGKVVIPQAVYRELTENPNYAEEAEEISNCNFLRVENVENQISVKILRNVTGLDQGESESIVLVDEKKADLLIIDEHKGRSVAKQMGVTFTGTVGMLLQAYDERYLSKCDVEDCISRLKESNIRISESLYKIVYEHIGK